MRLLVTMLTLGLVSHAFAQTPATPQQAVLPEVQNTIAQAPVIALETSATVHASIIPLKTPIRFTLDTAISSKTAVIGSQFQLKVSEDLVINGVVVIPAGTPATGEIIHAQKSSVFGKAGELLLAIRYIDLHGQKIRMRSFQPYQGKDATNVAMGASFAIGMFAAFIHGGEIEMPANTLVQALVAAETSVDLQASPVLDSNPSSTVSATQPIIDDTTPPANSATPTIGDSQ
ncbi:MAG: hypothetical protein ACREO1_13315 [Arenimonas sp.]